MYAFTHRCVFSSFSAEEIDRRKQVLKASGIAFDVKMHPRQEKARKNFTFCPPNGIL